MVRAVQSGANLVKSASVSNLGGLCKHYSGLPFTAQLPTLSKASDGLGPSQSPRALDANSCKRLSLCLCLPLLIKGACFHMVLPPWRPAWDHLPCHTHVEGSVG